MNELLEDLSQNNIVITPHLTKPLHDKDRKSPNEAIHLTTGIYNLGFIGMHRSVETSRFVHWWEDKLATECKIDLENGLFVDQKWVNFAPIYFDKVLINRYLGYNVAYWNLHEREISKENDSWVINEKYPLRFFHFSGYLLNKPSEISKYQKRFNFADRQDLLPIFSDYGKRLKENHNEYFQQFPCYYIKPKQLIYYQSLRKVIKYPLSRLLAFLEKIELKYFKYEILNNTGKRESEFYLYLFMSDRSINCSEYYSNC